MCSFPLFTTLLIDNMKRIIHLLFALLLFSGTAFTQDETFSDYFGSSEDYAFRQLLKNTEGRVDTLLGKCIDSIFANNLEAVLAMSRDIVTEYPEQPFGYLMRSIAWADLDNPTAAMDDINLALELAPDLMIAYTVKSRYYLYDEDVKNARLTMVTASERLPDRPEPPFLTGALDYREHPIRARKLWEESVARDSCYAPARVAILVQRAGAGRLGKGIKELEELLDCEDVSSDVFYLLALAEESRNNDGKAMEYANITLDLSPGWAKPLRVRSRLYAENDRYVEAVEDLYDVFAANSSPRRRIVIRNNMGGWYYKIEAAFNYYMQYQGTYKKEYRDMLAKQLIYLYSASDFDENKMMKEALRGPYGEEPATLYFAGIGETSYNDNKEKALKFFDAALSKDSNIPDIHRMKGEYSLGKDDFRGAYESFRALSELQPRNKVAFHGMATALEGVDKVKGTVNLYTKVLELDSTDVRALQKMGDIGFGNNNFKVAMKYYDKYLDEAEDMALIRHNRAVCRYLLGDISGAREDLAGLSGSYQANNIQAINLRGLVRMEQDSLDLALGDFNSIIFKESDNLDAHYNRARVYSKLKDWRQSVLNLDIVLEKEPENRPALFERALAKFELGDRTACGDLQKVIELGLNIDPEIVGKICGP